MKHTLRLIVIILTCSSPVAFSQSFTIQQMLSAPFPTGLCAAPARGRIAWAADSDGKRNIWMAEPGAKGKNYTSRQLTHYSEDDGQELTNLLWTLDGANIIYVRGGDAQGPTHPVPNPAWSPRGLRQQIWAIGADGAGVDLHGIFDWGVVLPQLSPDNASPEHMQKAVLAHSSSPIASILTWRSPVLMIHGDDRNAPFAETVQQAEALRKQGVDFEELIFPDEIHGFLLRRTWLRTFAATQEFFDRKLIGKL